MTRAILNKVGIIKGINGGDNTFLNQQKTISGCLPLNTVFEFLVGGIPNKWLLRTGSNASDGISYQRPDDFDALTNAVVWERIN